MEILSVVNMVPVVVLYRNDGEENRIVVYLDYASHKVLPTEDVGDVEGFRKAVFAYLAKQRKPATVPEAPRSGFHITPRADFNNSD